MRALGESLRCAPTPCDNHIQRESLSASSAPACSAITRDTKDCDMTCEKMAAKKARVSGPMHLPCTEKLRISALYGQVNAHSATITYNAKASVLAACQHVLLSLVTRYIATRLTKERQPTSRASLVRCICPAQQNYVAASCMAKRNKKARSTIARAVRSNEPFGTSHTHTQNALVFR